LFRELFDMAREAVFTAREAKMGAWVVAITALLLALGLSGMELGSPSIPDRPDMRILVDEAQPLAAADLAL
jgi:hypothetical protein